MSDEAGQAGSQTDPFLGLTTNPLVRRLRGSLLLKYLLAVLRRSDARRAAVSEMADCRLDEVAETRLMTCAMLWLKREEGGECHLQKAREIFRLIFPSNPSGRPMSLEDAGRKLKFARIVGELDLVEEALSNVLIAVGGRDHTVARCDLRPQAFRAVVRLARLFGKDSPRRMSSFSSAENLSLTGVVESVRVWDCTADVQNDEKLRKQVAEALQDFDAYVSDLQTVLRSLPEGGGTMSLKERTKSALRSAYVDRMFLHVNMRGAAAEQQLRADVAGFISLYDPVGDRERGSNFVGNMFEDPLDLFLWPQMQLGLAPPGDSLIVDMYSSQSDGVRKMARTVLKQAVRLLPPGRRDKALLSLAEYILEVFPEEKHRASRYLAQAILSLDAQIADLQKEADALKPSAMADAERVAAAANPNHLVGFGGLRNYQQWGDLKELQSIRTARKAAVMRRLIRLADMGVLRSCGGCGKLETLQSRHQSCAGCRVVSYCSRECQTAHWKKAHKRECKQLQATRRAAQQKASGPSSSSSSSSSAEKTGENATEKGASESHTEKGQGKDKDVSAEDGKNQKVDSESNPQAETKQPAETHREEDWDLILVRDQSLPETVVVADSGETLYKAVEVLIRPPGDDLTNQAKEGKCDPVWAERFTASWSEGMSNVFFFNAKDHQRWKEAQAIAEAESKKRQHAVHASGFVPDYFLLQTRGQLGLQLAKAETLMSRLGELRSPWGSPGDLLSKLPEDEVEEDETVTREKECQGGGSKEGGKGSKDAEREKKRWWSRQRQRDVSVEVSLSELPQIWTNLHQSDWYGGEESERQIAAEALEALRQYDRAVGFEDSEDVESQFAIQTDIVKRTSAHGETPTEEKNEENTRAGEY
uniref:MYND-type domain-containing protein n=1 Tax=Chromera velia CCMP2878 TaxID=1169474 RepID=A0A0G4G9D1_9ALVE|eukprot:Cvel_20839.t1-p1 / transcript=Cvel_20839.t1 / gene=Cvel_20839 / organism=Chromera_velia_CCMP2878 / gene_product=hypothetical protein / transcript_product=hypothetical protein / location=Cvel_scaffold1907:14172-19090(+) / protein_length=873 / sequence_SO=supercontig / SO=protein_coding / is_pseudo=false